MTAEPIFVFSDDLNVNMQKIIESFRFKINMNKANPFSLFYEFLKDRQIWLRLLNHNYAIEEVFFYGWINCIAIRWKKFFLSPNQEIIMANLAALSCSNAKIENVYVSNHLLFGLSLLLLKNLSRNNVTIYYNFSDASGINACFSELLKEFGSYFPNCLFKEVTDTANILDNSLFLGGETNRKDYNTPDFFNNAPHIKGGIFFAPVIYAGTKKYAPLREKWIESGLLRSILQIPAIRGDYIKTFNILIVPGIPSSSFVRMAEYMEQIPATGIFNLAQCLDLLSFSQPQKPASIDVPICRIISDGEYNLTPSYYLAPQIDFNSGKNVLLRGKARILRCQIGRQKVNEGDMQSLEPGEIITREISVSDCDSITGFVNEDLAPFVRIALNENSPNAKYFLKENDIIFVFRGTKNSLAQTGFIPKLENRAVAGLSTCIIRALPELDPVWLYYYLRRPFVLAFLRSRATGGEIINLNVNALLDLPIKIPDEEELMEIHARHNLLLANSIKIKKLRQENWHILKSINPEEED